MNIRIYYLLPILLFLLTSLTKAQINKQQQDEIQQAQLQYEREQRQVDSLIKTHNLEKRFYSEGRLFELMRVENGRPIYYATDNIDAQATIAVDEVHPGGVTGFDLTGNGITLGEWDGGAVRLTHQEFGDRVNQADDASKLSGHATHVAGIMVAAGVRTEAEGMSFEANLDAHSWGNAGSEMRSAASNGLPVSNHSYGTVVGWGGRRDCDDIDTLDKKYPVWHGNPNIDEDEDYRFGFYTNGAKRWDDIAHDHPGYLIVKSAGNDRGNQGPGAGEEHCVNINGNWQLSTTTRQPDGGEDGFDSMGSKGNAKNILAVGAVRDIDDGYSQPSDVQVSGFTSFGPPDDGRVKPDVVGNGVGLLSPNADSDDSYARLSGTSMSAPNVSGSIGLLLEYYKRLNGNANLRSATVKSLLIQTTNEAGSNPGPDYKHGWGLVNIRNAAELIKLDNKLDGGVIQQLTLQEGDTVNVPVEVAPDSDELKVTVGWTDPPGTPPSRQLDPRTPMLVNNLDLKLIGPDTTHYPWNLDPENPSAAATKGKNNVDNIEKAKISNPTSGRYIVQVTHDGSLDGGSQDFSLVLDRGPGETYTSSGQITISGSGGPAAGVDLDLSGFSTDSTETDSTGQFTFYGLYEGDYNVVPSARGVSFTPDSVEFTIAGDSVSGLDFTANTPGKRKISLTLNTATLSDTLRESDTLEVRGDIAGTDSDAEQLPDGNILAWDDRSTLHMNNTGGDYWKLQFEIPEMEEIDFKFFSRKNESIGVGGLEDGSSHTIKAEVGHKTYPLHYFERNTKEDKEYVWEPFDQESGTHTVLFRLYVTDKYNPFLIGAYGDDLGGNGPLRLTQPRVSLEPESAVDSLPGSRMFSGVAHYDTSLAGKTQTYHYEFTLSDWREDPDRVFTVPDQDTTIHWRYPNNVRPVVSGESITVKQDTFAVVNVLENDESIDGDSLYIATIENPEHGSAALKGDSLIKYQPDSNYTGSDEVVYYVEDGKGARVKSGIDVEVEVATSLEDDNQLKPEEFALQPNYPNPFNPSTTIQYALPHEAHVTLKIYNTLGREVARLVDKHQNAGNYSIRWNARNMNSGIYFYRIKADEFQKTRKMILVK